MAMVRDWSAAALAFQVGDDDVDRFSVIRYRGAEGLCRLYRFEIELASAEESVVFDDIVGKPAVLSINPENGERWFHGIVGRFETMGETAGQNYYRAELVPSLWLLTHRYSSRIFQDMTVVEIITDVLVQGGIPSDRFNLGGLTRTYEPREYCVQYRETDYNFVCRLMEEEGIWWYFEQTKEGHTLVAADDASAYAPIEGEAAIPYHPPTGMNVDTEHIFRFRLGQAVRPGKCVYNDFNFKNPALKLESTSDAGRDAALEFSDYPGEYGLQSAGGDLAKLRMEEFEASRFHGAGQSSSSRLGPGKTFDLIEHPNLPLNRSYLITAVTHEGRQSTNRTVGGSGGNGRGDLTAHRTSTEWLYHGGQVAPDPASAAAASGGDPVGALAIPNLMADAPSADSSDDIPSVYECSFECIPSDVTYRPPRITPWPVMRGAQTARVVGPESEEIYTDEYGRVKVHFNWDRVGDFKGEDSCWIRVSQGMAGGQYGMMFLPRVGQEVIVDFLEGDPDQPIITGRVYNADHMPPYSLPDEKTKSVIKTRSTKKGGGSNEIRFEDAKDNEQLLLYGQKDIHIRAQHNCVETVGCDRHLTVNNNLFELIKKNYHLKVEKENRNVEIGGDESLAVAGKASISVDGTHSTTVGGDVVEKFGAAHKHEVAMTYALKALSVKIEASAGIELKCGGCSIVLTPAAIFIVGGPLVNINSGSGPPVGPVSAKATSPEEPKAPSVADTVSHGSDTRYSGGGEVTPAEAPEGPPGHDVEPTETEEEKKSWIRIRLVDEVGEPIPSERYRITCPDGTVKEGTTDANGRASMSGIDPATCKIEWPELDRSAWRRKE